MESDNFKKMCNCIIKAYNPYQLVTAEQLYLFLRKKKRCKLTFFQFKQFLQNMVGDGPFHVYIRSSDMTIFYFYKDDPSLLLGKRKANGMTLIPIIKDNLEKNEELTKAQIKERFEGIANQRTVMILVKVLMSFGFIEYNENRSTYRWNKIVENKIPYLRDLITKEEMFDEE